MSKRIKGITVEIGGDTVGLEKALKDVNNRTRDVQKELRDVDRLLKFDPKNTELLAQRQKILGEAVATTSEKLDELKKAEADVQRQFEQGEIKEEQYRAFQRELADTESRLKHYQRRLQESTSKTREFGQSLQRAGKRVQDAGGKMKDVGGRMAKNVTAPILAVGAAIGAATIKAGQWADAMLDTASKTGISTDALQAFERIEAKAGITTGTMASQVENLNKKFADGELDAKKVGIAVDKMGISFEDFVDLPAEEKMDAVMGSMQGMSQQERIDLANLLGITDLLPALDAADGEWSEFKDEMSEGAISEENLQMMANFTNGLNEMWQQMRLALTKALIPLIEKFEEFRPQLEEKLVPAMEKVGEWVARLVEWFFNLDGSIQKIILIFFAVVAAIGPLLLILAPVITMIGTLITVAGTLTISLGALVAPILIAIAVIGSLIAIGILLWKNWDTIMEKARNLVDMVKMRFTEFKFEVGKKMEETKAKISEIWNNVVNFFKNIDLRQIGKDIINGLIGGIASMGKELFKTAGDLAKGVGDAIKRRLGVGSPSKVTMELGEFTGEGLAIGLQNTMSRVKAMSNDMAQAAVPDIDMNAEAGKNQAATAGRSMTVNINSPKALDVREANREFTRSLNRMSLMW